MKLKVMLFAEIRQTFGQREIEIDCQQAATVAALRNQLKLLAPDAAALIERSAIAINHAFATPDQSIPADAEIALIPPVSGG